MRPILTGILLLLIFVPLCSQEANYDEALVPTYTLPPLFQGGGPPTVASWTNERARLLRMFEREMYGQFPGKRLQVSFEETKKETMFDGMAEMREVTMTVASGRGAQEVHILIFLPTGVTGPVPLFLGLNFYGNHTVHASDKISIPTSWVRNNEGFGITENKATAKGRGVRSSRWPIDTLLTHGFGLATIYYGDVDPDFDDDFENGIHGLVKGNKKHFSSISAWAWALSRAMDYFEQEASIDQHRIAVIGHSRLGKTSLWAGATDPRFALVISNDSGCGGAALSRRAFGETVQRINQSFPHWFCAAFDRYNNNEASLPIDQHMLIAVMAPRPVYVASAEEDRWADPRGEFLSIAHASKVYRLYGDQGIEADRYPEVNMPYTTELMGYHRRSGRHDINMYDWRQYILFAKQVFGN